MAKIRNQINYSLRGDAKRQKFGTGTLPCKMFIKKDGCSMMIANGLSYNAAESLALYIQKFLKDHNVKLNGTFIFTK